MRKLLSAMLLVVCLFLSTGVMLCTAGCGGCEDDPGPLPTVPNP